MEVTIDFIKSSFDKFNMEYFGNTLVTPSFEISHCRRALGDFRGSRKGFRIRVSDYYVRPRKDLEQTILHEMIHLYQKQFNFRDKSHGEIFKQMAFEINRKGGWKISRVTSTKGCKVNPKFADKENKPKAYHMMVYKSISGKYFLFRMGLRNVSKWVDTVLYHRPSIIRYATFTSDDKYFDTFPSCRTVARGSYITEEKYNELIERYNLRVQEKLTSRRAVG